MAFALAPLALALLVGPLRFDAELLFRDPAASTGSPPYLGFFSNLGILAWCVAGTSSLLAALTLPPSRARAALGAGGLLAAALTLDDMFLLHESVLPFFGVPENLVLACYAASAITYLWVFRDVHRLMDWPLLLASLTLLGSSVVLDVLAGDMEWLILEDGTKFAGICAWCAYHLLAARYWLRRALGTDRVAHRATGITP
ncbi:hypothetical protein OF850_02740 [Roseococcus sp. MDT2-1-1]|uniref:Oxidase n=1 Tax=Sabulicella glaciei TaxID=2984948 RepID=A0ABT3NQV3_9PROT|nr:hypothetical protein [Roseococcus sp. MDT2-1-1]